MTAPLIVGLDVAGRPAVVIGGGAVATRKVERLLGGGAAVSVIAPSVDEPIRAAAADGRLAWRDRGYADGDLAGAMLVVAATDDAATNAAVAADADACGIWCVRADRGGASEAQPARPGSAAFTATVQRGPLQLAVSTGGAGPALAAHLVAELDAAYGPEWGELAALLGELRADPRVAAALAGCDQAERARRWRSVLAADTLTYLRTGDRPRAREVALSCLSSPSG